ncbi:MAG: LEA type 2 family protein [Planctomycetota bacterium]
MRAPGRTLMIVVCVWSAACLSACSRYAAPQISVADARVAERTSQGVVIDFTLDAVNTNEVELPLKSIEYALYLDGRRVFDGARQPEATLRRFGTQQIRVPAAFSLDRVEDPTGSEIPYRLEGKVVYLTPGELADVAFDARVYRPSVSFSDRGRIDFGTPIAAWP